MRMRRSWLTAAGVAVALLGTTGWFWQRSLMPSTYSVMDFGYVDTGGGPAPASMAAMPHADMDTVPHLTDHSVDLPDVSVTLVARRETYTLPTGQTVTDGFTLNHSSPGPLIRAEQGDLVQVTLVNESVGDGVTLHWHGIDVPNAMDGVAGVTQDAVPVGGRFVYRFHVNDAGTYWYHSHQHAEAQIPNGLYGTFIVEPKTPSRTGAGAQEVVAALHTYGQGRWRSINGRTGLQWVSANAGQPVRLRVVDTDSKAAGVLIGGVPYRAVAVDGHDINAPTELTDISALVAAGGRMDFEFRVPASGAAVRVDLGGGAQLAVGPPGARIADAGTGYGTLDLLTYGKPAPVGFDAAHPDRRFEYRIGKRIGFNDGVPWSWWTVNGHLFPDVPMFTVDKGDIVVMTISNTSGINHPMHLHGHHALVLSRDGVPSTGSPWWTDSLNVDGSTYQIAFVADNPGIWLDHCHNLPHAADGLMSHLVYSGVSEPFRIGGVAHNHPE
jgi:FtsP/CotA-like multicopper oxidase with cupredoxin domain